MFRWPGPPQYSVWLPLQVIVQPLVAGSAPLEIDLPQSACRNGSPMVSYLEGNDKRRITTPRYTRRSLLGGRRVHLQHSPPYSTPAKVYPAALHPDVQAATVIWALATPP